jgi:pimeloyl-ACP methyl ester carboxylesterase
VRPAYLFLPLLLPVLVSGFGCGGKKPVYPVPRPGAAAGSVVTEPRPLKIGSDEYEADYGTITVPENRSTSTSRLISIPFLRIHSPSTRPSEPVFGFAGGPGASNMTWDWGKARTFLPEHDFVLVGYRGVDGSTVLDCPEVAEAMKGDDNLLGVESMERIGRAWTASAKRLSAQGVDLDGYTMLETLEDNESVRRALGFERINLLSESYGTRVAYLYGLNYPDRVFRSAMISVNPPGHFVWQPRTIDAQLKHYATLWSRDSVMSRKSPDLYATMRTVLSDLPHRWLFLPINPGKVKVATFALLFQRNTSAMVFDAYVAAERGDPSGLALMSLAYDYLLPSMFVWGDLASKATSADSDSSPSYSRGMEPDSMPLGTPMSTLLWGPLAYTRWPTRQLPEKFRKPRHSGVETLLLSGSVDFSTPPEFATKELLPCLTHGQQVILSECGHVNDMWYANIENTRLLLDSFYKTGVPNTSLNAYLPMDFTVRWGFPKVAKLALGALAFLVLALCALIMWLARRHRRSKASLPISKQMNSSLPILLVSGLVALSTECFSQDSTTHSSLFPSGIHVQAAAGHLVLRDEHISDQKYAGSSSSITLSWSRFHETYGYRIGLSYRKASHITNYNVSAEVSQGSLTLTNLYPIGKPSLFGKDAFVYLGPSAEVFMYYRKQNIAQNTDASPNVYQSGIWLMSLGARVEMVIPFAGGFRIESALQAALLSFGGGTGITTSTVTSLTLLTPLAAFAGCGEIGFRYYLLSWASIAAGYRLDVTRISSWTELLSSTDNAFASLSVHF